ncbi:MAG: hypothetical protein AAF581_13030 [Planctomycetota bacterium]
MFNDKQVKDLLSALTRIADALETLAVAVDEDEQEINVYVSGEVSMEEEDEE